jgi:tetratricopeptide (TPR) repeat protein/type II secretory pathway predicted ATPase ExeA
LRQVSRWPAGLDAAADVIQRVSYPAPNVPQDSLFPSSRFSATERRAALAGRAAEMRELERAYAAARDKRQTRTVTVVGAAGLGKTRLVRDFLVRTRDATGAAPRVFRGSAREGGPAYEVFARVLRARFGTIEGMDPEAAKAQVRTQLAAVLEDRKVGDVAYFLGQLLDLGFQDSPLIKAVEGDPQQIRSMRRAIIKSFLETDASKAKDPLVLMFDDLEWAHDDSLELLSYLVESLRGPMLLVCIARPEMLARRDGWQRSGSDRHLTIELSPLADADAASVMKDLLGPCGDVEEVDELVDSAVTLAGGNPALLEQIVRIYHDSGVLQVTDDFEDERWSVHPDKLADVKLPLTVQDAVQARIAALVSEERQLLEKAAAMGGVFWLGGLVAIHRQSESPPEVWEAGEAAEDVVVIRQLLGDLIERDYVLRLPDSTFPGDEEFVFKHNLEREALVRLTPPAAARRQHRAIAEWLTFRENADASEEYLEMLARHREKAGAVALAAGSYVQAAEEARSRYANAKAADLFAKGLQLLEQCDPADEDLRLKALHHHGDVLQALGRNDEAYRAFVELLTRAWRLDLRSKGGAAHSRIGRLCRETGRLDEASRQLTASLALFGQAQDEQGTAGTLDDIGRLHWLKGDHALAVEYISRALSMRRRIGDARNLASTLHNLGLVQQDSGNYKAAVEALDESLRIRRSIGDLVGASHALDSLGGIAQAIGDEARARAMFQEAYEAAKETGDRNRIALIVTNLGATYDRAGDASKALGLFKQAEDLADELGDRVGLADARSGLGRAYAARRDFAKARDSMRRAVELFTEAESKVKLGVALRSLGAITAATSAGEWSEGADHLKRSIAIFEELGNDVELARSFRAYAELLRRAPDAADASVAAEAQKFAGRAEDIFAKVKATVSERPGRAAV